jgi:hypothetical protein
MKIPLIVLVVFLGYPILNFHQKSVLTEAEVIKLAEDFVKTQGYTNEPPISDKSKWSPDSVWGTPTEDEMVDRRNLIENGAYGVANNRLGTLPWDWIVVFRYNPKHEPFRRLMPDWEEKAKKTGMVIWVDKHGEHIGKVHQDIYLNDKLIKVIDKSKR